MANQVRKPKVEIATIDCSLITIETADGEFGFDTANQIQVEPQIDEQESVTLVVKGILRAQKPVMSTITRNTIKITNNLFNPELVLILQGGHVQLALSDVRGLFGRAYLERVDRCGNRIDTRTNDVHFRLFARRDKIIRTLL